MRIAHQEIRELTNLPPEPEGWAREWHGLFRLVECWGSQSYAKFKQGEKAVNARGVISERQFEVDCFLAIMQDIIKSKVITLELGAGWGEWCMATAGIVRHKIVPTNLQEYQCVGVEADQHHYDWMLRHFQANQVKGVGVRCLIADKEGEARFNVDRLPAENYGQSASFKQSNYGWGLLNFLRRSTVKVDAFTLDELLRDFVTPLKGEYAVIAHMDIQGLEYEVLKNSQQYRGIDYFLIGTHRADYNSKIRHLLEKDYECQVDLPPNGEWQVSGIGKVNCGDGVLLLKQRTRKS